MIIREWRARAALSNRDAYPAHFRTNVLPELRALSGFLGAHLSSRDIDGGIEFLVLTRWESLEAIAAFASEPINGAVVEPGAVAALVEFNDFVVHYEVIEEA
jgi:heme-degrading monooxygenase HmoA